MTTSVSKVKRMRKALMMVNSWAFVYSIDNLYQESIHYLEELDNAYYSNDDSLLCSAYKLASRFMCTAASILVFYLARDIRERRLEQNHDHDFGNFINDRSTVHGLKSLMHWL